MKLIHMVGFNGILGIRKEEDLKMIKDKLIDGKKSYLIHWSKTSSESADFDVMKILRSLLGFVLDLKARLTLSSTSWFLVIRFINPGLIFLKYSSSGNKVLPENDWYC